MRWHQTRQGLLAENVANADTPGYQGRDLAPYSFSERLGQVSSADLGTRTTRPMHISVSSSSVSGHDARRLNSFEVTPEGNGVSLEDEMMKVTSNLMDYQAATSLYQKSVRILKNALGRQA
ncbi:flagellar biosynthesis protein FlgB [Devosia pacifica]|uniref:Flagellar basal body rod protein FlgB n=2 Tax=Devosia pacifica TaxID=1335967 RepID=A0A918VPG4_9HYPH|nr:flagellar biosynthesis protein FlgB [Devosia pacifica]